MLNEAGAPGERIAVAIERALADEGITVDTSQADRSAARDALRSGELDVVIVLPRTCSWARPARRLCTSSRRASTQPTMPGMSPGCRRRSCRLAGGTFPTIEPETIYGAPGDQLDAFAPALVAFFSYFLVFILTGISFLRERIGGTLERLLATPAPVRSSPATAPGSGSSRRSRSS